MILVAGKCWYGTPITDRADNLAHFAAALVTNRLWDALDPTAFSLSKGSRGASGYNDWEYCEDRQYEESDSGGDDIEDDHQDISTGGMARPSFMALRKPWHFTISGFSQAAEIQMSSWMPWQRCVSGDVCSAHARQSVE
jgi:hypothetical protein